jgi:hypothetical protein
VADNPLVDSQPHSFHIKKIHFLGVVTSEGGGVF